MQVVNADLIRGKKVLLRLDIDVPIIDGVVGDEFRLEAGMSTLILCLEHAREVIIMGHIGRPEGKRVEELSVAPIYDWLGKRLEELGPPGGGFGVLGNKLKLLENLRFEAGEEDCDLEYAQQLASLGEIYINEAFASYHPSASTTVLPSLLPHYAGLHFAKEVETLKKVRENPQQPLVVIIGGVKAEDKLPTALQMAKIADKVLVGGKITQELADLDWGSVNNDGSCRFGISGAFSVAEATLRSTPETSPPRHPSSVGILPVGDLPDNVYLAKLRDDGKDIKEETVQKWAPIISNAKMILWNGPMGLIEDPKYNQTERIAQLVIESGAESIVGGGDTVSYLNFLGDLPEFSFVSTGGGAMLKFLETGTLPTIEALE